MNSPDLVHYLPVITTILSAIFAVILLRRWSTKKEALHLLWWGMGVVAYGIGTALESTITIFGNSIFLTKAWYVAGALLGGYPLAQGSVYLLYSRKFAHRLTKITLPFIMVVAVLVVISPVDMSGFNAIKPSGDLLAWNWVRWMTPFINGYAALFLIGGAIVSAIRYYKNKGVGDSHRALGNTFIAIGGILPGIGGTMAKTGIVEALYIGELVGLIFIWAGFQVNVKAPWAPPK